MRKITYFLNEGDRNRLLNEDSTIFFEFKEVIDIYCVTDKARGLKEHAIYGNASGGSCFLLKIQNLGHTSLSTITDEDTLPFFVGDDGKAWTSSCYKKEISAIYGLKRLGMFVASMVVTAIIGLLMGNIQGVFLFLLFFIPLRILAGGLHLPALWMCAIASSLLIVAVAFILNSTDGGWINESLYSAILIIGTLVIMILAPVDTVNKLLFKEEKVRFKLISIVITVVEEAIFFICQDIDFIKMLIFLVITIEAFYLTVQKVINILGLKRSKCEKQIF